MEALLKKVALTTELLTVYKTYPEELRKLSATECDRWMHWMETPHSRDVLTACVGKLHTMGLASEHEKKLALALAEKVATAPEAEPQTMLTTGRRSPQVWHDALQHNLPLHI